MAPLANDVSLASRNLSSATISGLLMLIVVCTSLAFFVLCSWCKWWRNRRSKHAQKKSPPAPTVIRSDYYKYHPKKSNVGKVEQPAPLTVGKKSLSQDRQKTITTTRRKKSESVTSGQRTKKRAISRSGADLSSGQAAFASITLDDRSKVMEFVHHDDPAYQTLGLDVDDPFIRTVKDRVTSRTFVKPDAITVISPKTKCVVDSEYINDPKPSHA